MFQEQSKRRRAGPRQDVPSRTQSRDHSPAGHLSPQSLIPKADAPWLSLSFGRHSAAPQLVGTGPHPCLVCADSESQKESQGLRPQTEGKAGTWPRSSTLQRRRSSASSPQRTDGWDPSRIQEHRAQEQATSPTHHFGLEGRLDLPVLEFLPVDPPEEGMFPHVPLPLWPATQPLAWVFGHQLESSRKRVRWVMW